MVDVRPIVSPLKDLWVEIDRSRLTRRQKEVIENGLSFPGQENAQGAQFLNKEKASIPPALETTHGDRLVRVYASHDKEEVKRRLKDVLQVPPGACRLQECTAYDIRLDEIGRAYNENPEGLEKLRSQAQHGEDLDPEIVETLQNRLSRLWNRFLALPVPGKDLDPAQLSSHRRTQATIDLRAGGNLLHQKVELFIPPGERKAVEQFLLDEGLVPNRKAFVPKESPWQKRSAPEAQQ